MGSRPSLPARRVVCGRRSAALATVVVVLTAAGAEAAPLPANERRMRDWLPMSVTMGADHVVYARSSATTIRYGGYTVWRTDTYRMPIRGTRFIDGRLPGVVLRTSIGRTTAGPLAIGPNGTHLLVATGRGFTPQVTFCCENSFHDVPLEAQSRPEAPRTVAAAIDGDVARLAMVDPRDGLLLATQDLPPAVRRRQVRLGARPPRDAVAVAPGIVAWLDADGGVVRVARLAPGAPAPVPDAEITPEGSVRRIVATERTVVLVVDRPGGGTAVVRHDAPGWTPLVVWRGTRPPDAVAAGDRTLVIATGTSLLQHVPGGPLRRLARIRSRAVGLATDGARVVVLERLTIRRPRRPVLRQTAMRVLPVIAPPAAVTASAR